MEHLEGWKIGGVSVAGFSHIEEDIPCQDAHAFTVLGSDCLIAAVADGAGSARLSHLGSEAFADAVVEALRNDLSELEFDGERASDVLTKAVNDTKDRLMKDAQDSDDNTAIHVSDFAATLIVVVANSNGGAFFHVGDGAGTVFSLGNSSGATVSKPENGEYANETYFVTADNWESHLRVTPFSGEFDTILLMSDGVTPMAMTKGCALPFDNFVGPVLGFLRGVDEPTAKKALINTLSDEKVRTVTGDDKTLIWATKVFSEPSG